MLDPTLNQALRTNGEAVWFGWPSDDRLEELRARWLKASDSEPRQEIYARRARRPRFCYVAAGQTSLFSRIFLPGDVMNSSFSKGSQTARTATWRKPWR